MKYPFLILNFLLITSKLISQGAECASALHINSVANYCSGNATFSNAGSTPGKHNLPSCWEPTATEDVWFEFSALGTDVLISVSGVNGGGTMIQPRIAIYSGNCKDLLTELNCTNGTVGFGTTQLYKAGLTPGNTYFIRIATTQANEGSFELCVNSYTPSTNPGADCNGASFLCNQHSISVASLGGGGANNHEIESGTCLYTGIINNESNSSWFYWTCGTSGSLEFDITPVNPLDDLDFIFYELKSSDPCGPRTPIRCCASSCLNETGSTGMSLTDNDTSEMPGCQTGDNAYIKSVTMVSGTSYALLVNNFSANTGFTLTFNSNNTNGGTFFGPNPQISSSAISICSGDSVVFDGALSKNCSTLNWNFTQNGFPSIAVGPGPHTVSYASKGDFTAILNGVDSIGCKSIDFVNIHVKPSIQVGINPFDTICSGNTVIQNITTDPSGGTLTFSAGSNSKIIGATNGIGDTINQTLINTSGINQNITYYVNANLDGCSEIDSCIVTVNAHSKPTFNYVAALCQGIQTAPSLSNQSLEGIIGSWTPSNINTQQLGTTNYKFTPMADQCADTAILEVTIVRNPEVLFSADKLLSCTPLLGTLSTQSIAGTSYTWQIDGQPSGNTPTINYNLVSPGCYDVQLQVVDSNGCSSSSILTDYLCVEADPVASFSYFPNVFSFPSENIRFYNTSIGNNTYSWDYGNGNSSSQIEEIHAFKNTTKGYYVTLTAASSAGCIDSVTHFIGYEEPLVYYIPNTFTPDHDDLNKLWNPIFTSGYDPYNFHLMIFDRWGELIWESYDSTIGWDGTYNKNIPVQEGIYTWVIIFGLSKNDDMKIVSGFVNLLR
jgi:gliding motility-associated-like protein